MTKIEEQLKNKRTREQVVNENHYNPVLKLPGVYEALMDQSLGFVKILANKKVPYESDWTHLTLTVDDIALHNGNVGVRVGENIVGIDIDGLYIQNSTNKDYTELLKLRLAQYLSEVVAEAFAPAGYRSDYPRPMIVKTASGKYHFYCKNGVLHKMEHFFKNYVFPSDFVIPEFQNKKLEGAIETFMKPDSHQLVLPFSTIDGRSYEVLDSIEFTSINGNKQILYGEKDITRIGEFDDICENIAKVLKSRGFIEAPTSVLPSDMEETYPSTGYIKHNVPSYYLDYFTDFILDLLIYLDSSNSKYYFSFALGGYFANYIPKESAEIITNMIIDKVHSRCREGFFKNDSQFRQAMLSSYDQADDDELRVAGVRCSEYVEGYISKEEFFAKMILYMGNSFKFYPAGRNGRRYSEVFFDQRRNIVTTVYCSKKQDDDGNYYQVADNVVPALGLIPFHVTEYKNPLNSSDVTFEVSCANSQGDVYVYLGDNLEDVSKQILNSFYGQTSRAGKQILAQIFQKFAELNYIQKSEKSKISGIFDLRHDGSLVRFDGEGYKVEPSFRHDELVGSVGLLEEIRDLYPLSGEKFGHICRVGLLLPFTKVLRDYGYSPRYLILEGAGGTLKTTMAEMLLSFYDDVRTIGERANEFGAGSFSSEYQVGEKFGLSGNGFIVNEPGKALQSPEIIEILKHAIENDIARKTMDGVYPSYQTAIFCTNIEAEPSDAIIRRSDIFVLSAKDRPSKQQLKQISRLLNDKGRKNSRFKELRAIGDFIYDYVYHHMELFSESLDIDDFGMKLVSALEQETGKDLSWLKSVAIEDHEVEIREEIDDNIINNFKKFIADTYNRHFRVLEGQQIVEDGIMTLDTDNDPFSMSSIKALIRRNAFPFIVPHVDPEYCILLKGPLKKWYRQEQNMLVTLEAFYNQAIDLSNDNCYDFKMGYFNTNNNKRKNGCKVQYQFIYDLLNNKL